MPGQVRLGEKLAPKRARRTRGRSATSCSVGSVKVARVETRRCNAGWRNYHFVKLTTEDGVVGWSEFDQHQGALGLSTIVEQLGELIVGQRVLDTELCYQRLLSRARQSMTGVMAMAIGAIENALLDAKAKVLGVPCYDLLGGKLRDRVRVYWSHCATWRIALPQYYGSAITDLEGVARLGSEVREQGFTALKTNIFDYSSGTPRGWAPGFGRPFAPEQNVDRKIIEDLRRHLQAFREGAGPDVDILLDLNFNAKTEGYLQLVRALADLDLFWIEIDTPSAEALATIRSQSSHPISSCETLLTLGAFLPFFHNQSMDVAIVDAVWNGVWQSLKIAACADAHQVNVAPHNYYGHLATMMNAHLSAAVPNLRIMETDIDRLPWDEELFTVVPKFEDGYLVVPDTPGWGTEPDEKALEKYPPS